MFTIVNAFVMGISIAFRRPGTNAQLKNLLFKLRTKAQQRLPGTNHCLALQFAPVPWSGYTPQ